jgi:hypothetical protein
MCYTFDMRKDSLINTNPYLKNSKWRKRLLAETVISSTAIEGVHLSYDELETPLFVSGKPFKFSASLKTSESGR